MYDDLEMPDILHRSLGKYAAVMENCVLLT